MTPRMSRMRAGSAARAEGRILVTIDTDFGELVYVREVQHAGLVRLPDVPAARRIALMAEVLERYRSALELQAVVTIRDGGSASPGRRRHRNHGRGPWNAKIDDPCGATAARRIRLDANRASVGGRETRAGASPAQPHLS